MILELIERDVELKKVTPKEYAGPCPWCGGTDRLHVWPDSDTYKCLGYDEGRAGCGKQGDPIQWLRDKRGLTFVEAAAQVGKIIEPRKDGSKATPALRPPENVEHPAGLWQDKAWELLNFAQDEMDSERGAKAENWLAMRGLNHDTIHQAGIGYWPTDTYGERADWGLEKETNANGKLKKVWTPRGIVIPWIFRGYIWRIRFRRPLTDDQVAKGEAKYIQLPGCSNGLYGASELTPGCRAVLVESELDALLLRQEAGHLCIPVATGGTGGARRAKWMAMLAQCERVLIAYDADEAGQKAAAWWADTLKENGRIWRPLWGDQTDMVKGGADLALWVGEGLK